MEDKRANNNLLNITQKTKDQASRTSLKIRNGRRYAVDLPFLLKQFRIISKVQRKNLLIIT